MNARINIISVLGIAESLADVVETRIFQLDVPDEIRTLSANLREATHAAFKTWPYHITKNELKRIEKQYNGVEVENKTIDIVMYSSFVLNIIDDVLEKIKHPVRRKVLMDIIDAVKPIHSFFDKDLDKEEYYIQAEKAAHNFSNPNNKKNVFEGV